MTSGGERGNCGQVSPS